jgi:phosphatidylserine/phosphatidylglycerophosphate/cardiolipin synthase-like enzyme
MVADGRRAIISTMNLTRRCLERTQDFLCVTADPELTGALTALFCADSKGLPAGPEARHPRLILGPDHARERIETLLRGARQSIRILDHKLSDPRIIRILEEQRRRGLEVDVIAGGGSLSHGRMILVDRQTAVLGSFALSERSLDARRELATLIHEPALITQLERRLEKMARRHA